MYRYLHQNKRTFETQLQKLYFKTFMLDKNALIHNLLKTKYRCVQFFNFLLCTINGRNNFLHNAADESFQVLDRSFITPYKINTSEKNKKNFFRKKIYFFRLKSICLICSSNLLLGSFSLSSDTWPKINIPQNSSSDCLLNHKLL